jgi:hypothetical protein
VRSSLIRKILGETRTIPVGIGATLAAGAIANSLLTVAEWRTWGGFALAAMLIATLIFSLTVHLHQRRACAAPTRPHTTIRTDQ